MSATFKPRAVHCVLAAFALATIICGLGWREARRERDRFNEMNRELAARMNAVEEASAAGRRDAEEQRFAFENKIRELEERYASLVQIRRGPMADLGDAAGPFADRAGWERGIVFHRRHD